MVRALVLRHADYLAFRGNDKYLAQALLMIALGGTLLLWAASQAEKAMEVRT